MKIQLDAELVERNGDVTILKIKNGYGDAELKIHADRVVVMPNRRPTELLEVPEDFKGSEFESMLKRAGKIVECGFHVVTIHRKSTNEWKNVLILDDETDKKFCHAFEFDKDASYALMEYLFKGIKCIEKQEAAAPRA